MTFCLGIKVSEGLVGIADTRITSGSELITASKMALFENGCNSFFIMTSGLRSVRDKAITYFEDLMAEAEEPFNRLYKAVNAFADQIRRVAEEDRQALEESKLAFNIHALVGGQMADDDEHKLFLIYPQGNWVEIQTETPFHIIGQSGYGKPVLDRTLKYTDSMAFALKVGCLAFDSTRISAADVDFPLDVVVYPKGSYQAVEHRFVAADLADISTWWQDHLRELVRELPEEWVKNIMGRLSHNERRRIIQKGAKCP